MFRKPSTPLLVLLSAVVTAALSILLFLIRVPNPNVILLTAVVFFTFYGGFVGGIPSGIVVIIYSLVFFSSPGQLFSYTTVSLEKVLVTAIFVPVMVLMVGILEQHYEKMKKELVKANEELLTLSRVDSLTGLPNRRSFDEVFAREFAHAIRKSRPLTLMIIDIDFFKNFNDTYGHLAGDQALRDISHTIDDEVRRAGDYVARYGGEEFAIVMPDTYEKGAAIVAERIMDTIDALGIVHENSTVAGHVTVSIGIASEYPDNTSDPVRLIEHADQALYRAKRAGRHRFVTFL